MAITRLAAQTGPPTPEWLLLISTGEVGHRMAQHTNTANVVGMADGV
jgi:hypothetical protein